jgi:hypothetical protein
MESPRVIFTGKLWKKGGGAFAFQRRWHRFSSRVSVGDAKECFLQLFEDGKPGEVVASLHLLGVALMEDNARHSHQFSALGEGGQQWRLKACSEQQLVDFFRRVHAAGQRGEVLPVSGSNAASGAGSSSSSGGGGGSGSGSGGSGGSSGRATVASVYALGAGAPTPAPAPRVACEAAAPRSAAVFSPHTPPLPPAGAHQAVSPELARLLQMGPGQLAGGEAQQHQPHPQQLFSPRTPALSPAAGALARAPRPPAPASVGEPSFLLSPDLVSPLSSAPPTARSVKEMRLHLLDDSDEEEGEGGGDCAARTPLSPPPSASASGAQPHQQEQQQQQWGGTAATPPLCVVQVDSPEWGEGGGEGVGGEAASPPPPHAPPHMPQGSNAHPTPAPGPARPNT